MNKEKVSLIISGGEYADITYECLEADYVIACDRGLDYADRYGVIPDEVIGDFDSVSDFNKEKIKKCEIRNTVYPREKDDTDTMLAMKRVLELGFKDIRMICAFGNRMDHAYANIQTAHYGAKKGAVVRIHDVDTEAVVFSNRSVRIPKKEGYGLSVFSLTDRCKGVDISGTKYELKDGELSNSFPLGQSNEFLADHAEISVSSGVIMLVLCKIG